LRIGIDLRPLGGASGRRGVGSYLCGLVEGLIAEAGSDELVLFHQEGAPPPPGLAAARAGITAVTGGGWAGSGVRAWSRTAAIQKRPRAAIR